jgi:hypothetical protein
VQKQEYPLRGVELRKEIAKYRRNSTPSSQKPAFWAGPPLQMAELAHAPVNELGVVFVFGAMARRLGFIVHRLQAGFPDCIAMREMAPGQWQRVRIEFEFESRNFLRHRHRVDRCDLIVCWRHNWRECPLEVIALRDEIAKIAEIGN